MSSFQRTGGPRYVLPRTRHASGCGQSAPAHTGGAASSRDVGNGKRAFVAYAFCSRGRTSALVEDVMQIAEEIKDGNANSRRGGPEDHQDKGGVGPPGLRGGGEAQAIRPRNRNRSQGPRCASRTV